MSEKLTADEIAMGLYTDATTKLTDRYKADPKQADVDLVMVLTIAQMLTKDQPEHMRPLLAMIITLAVRGLSQDIPANRMLKMLNPDMFNHLQGKCIVGMLRDLMNKVKKEGESNAD